MLALATHQLRPGHVAPLVRKRSEPRSGHFAGSIARRHITNKAAAKEPPHPWRQIILDNLPESRLLLEPKIVHGRSRDYSWRNPYLRSLLTMPFGTNHATKASIFEAQDVDDIRNAASLCYRHDMPMVLRGEGSGYTGGAYNLASGMVIDVKKLNKILDLDASKGTITVQAGISIDDIRETALSVGWDMRQYPTSNLTHKTTLSGFLQTTEHGIGSSCYGSTLDFGNIVDMKVIPIDESCHEIELDGVIDQNEIRGALRSLGTSAIVSEVTLALAPAQYWVDMAATFSTVEEAMKFAYHVQRSPTVSSREVAVLPSSMLTATLNLGERKTNIHFLQNKIPPAGHTPDKIVGPESLNNYDTQDFTMPDTIPETEVVVLLSVNEASLRFLNHIVRERGGHTVYLEHNRGGFGWLEASCWQQASFRLSRYFNGHPYGNFEIGFQSVDASTLNAVPNQMEAISRMIASTAISNPGNQQPSPLASISGGLTSKDPSASDIQLEESLSLLSSASELIDESKFLGHDIKHRPAWSMEFVKRSNGDTGIIAHTNFPIQAQNIPQLGARLDAIKSGLMQLQAAGSISSIMNPNAIEPQQIFLDGNSELVDLQKATKARFDPKGLLNPRQISM